MTRDDMQAIAAYYLRGASSKAVLEDRPLNVTRTQVNDFLTLAADYVQRGIRRGMFDDNRG